MWMCQKNVNWKWDPDAWIIFSFFQSFFGFGQSAEIDIILDGAATRRTAEVKTEDGKKERLYLYLDGETLSGKVLQNQHSFSLW